MTHENRRAFVGAIAWGGVAVIAVLLVFVIVQTFGLTSKVRETQQGNKSTLQAAQNAAQDAATATDRIEDCTTPGRKCYDDGQKQTAQYLSDLNRVIAYAAACADQAGVQTEAEVYACVIQRLADDDSRERRLADHSLGKCLARNVAIAISGWPVTDAHATRTFSPASTPKTCSTDLRRSRRVHIPERLAGVTRPGRRPARRGRRRLRRRRPSWRGGGRARVRRPAGQ